MHKGLKYLGWQRLSVEDRDRPVEFSGVSACEGNYMDQINNPLSDDEMDWLDDFLLYRIDEEEDEVEPGVSDEGILGIAELDGFLPCGAISSRNGKAKRNLKKFSLCCCAT